MPAAAVIPAPLAYIKVVAVKKLVVGFLTWWAWPCVALVTSCAGIFGLFAYCVPSTCSTGYGSECECRFEIALSVILQENCSAICLVGARQSWSFTLKKLECLRQAYAVNRLAWNNKIGLRHRWWLPWSALSGKVFFGILRLLCSADLGSNSCRSLFCWFLELK